MVRQVAAEIASESGSQWCDRGQRSCPWGGCGGPSGCLEAGGRTLAVLGSGVDTDLSS